MDIRTLDLLALQQFVSKDPTLVQKLIRHDAEEDGVTMLWQACALGMDKHALFLCQFQAEISMDEAKEAGISIESNVYDDDYLKPIDTSHGILNPQTNMVIISSDPNFRRKSGLASPLYIASQNNHYGCCETLVQMSAKKVDVNLERDSKATPLFIATQRNHLKIVDLLLRSGAEVDKQNSQKCTPFVLACSMGHTEAAMLLLQYGADHTNKDTGFTGLQWSKMEKRVATNHMLLKLIFLPEMQLRMLFRQWKDFTKSVKLVRRVKLQDAEEISRKVILMVEDDDSAVLFKFLKSELVRLNRLAGNTVLPTVEVLSSISFPVANLKQPELDMTISRSPSTIVEAEVNQGNTSRVSSAVLFDINDYELPLPEAPEALLTTRHQVEVNPPPNVPPASLRYWYLHKSKDDFGNTANIGEYTPEHLEYTPSHNKGMFTAPVKTNLDYFSPRERKNILVQNLRLSRTEGQKPTTVERATRHMNSGDNDYPTISAAAPRHPLPPQLSGPRLFASDYSPTWVKSEQNQPYTGATSGSHTLAKRTVFVDQLIKGAIPGSPEKQFEQAQTLIGNYRTPSRDSKLNGSYDRSNSALRTNKSGGRLFHANASSPLYTRDELAALPAAIEKVRQEEQRTKGSVVGIRDIHRSTNPSGGRASDALLAAQTPTRAKPVLQIGTNGRLYKVSTPHSTTRF